MEDVMEHHGTWTMLWNMEDVMEHHETWKMLWNIIEHGRCYGTIWRK